MATFLEEVLATTKIEGLHTTSSSGTDTVNRYTVPANRYARIVASVREDERGGLSSPSRISLLINDAEVLRSVRDDGSRIPSQTVTDVFYVEPGDVIKTSVIAVQTSIPAIAGGGRFYIHISLIGKPS